jgi:hypothetical protein
LEAKVDINLKIAKILSNALGWKINFNAFKGSKYSVAFPASDASFSPEEKEQRKKNTYNKKGKDDDAGSLAELPSISKQLKGLSPDTKGKKKGIEGVLEEDEESDNDYENLMDQ